jgi:chromosome segregation ATPase
MMDIKKLKQIIKELEENITRNATAHDKIPESGDLNTYKERNRLEEETAFFSKTLKGLKKDLEESNKIEKELEERFARKKEAYEVKEKEFEILKMDLIKELKQAVQKWQAEARPLAEAFRAEKRKLAEVRGAGTDYIFSDLDHIEVFKKEIEVCLQEF